EVRPKRVRLQAVAHSAIFLGWVTLPLHNCRILSLARAGRYRPSVWKNWLSRGLPREPIVGNSTLMEADVLRKRKKGRVLQSQMVCRRIRKVLDLCEHWIGVDEGTYWNV